MAKFVNQASWGEPVDTGKFTEHLIAALSLRALPGLGDRGYKLLVDVFGSPHRALAEGPGVLSGKGDGRGDNCNHLARLLLKAPDRKGATKTLEGSERLGCRSCATATPNTRSRC